MPESPVIARPGLLRGVLVRRWVTLLLLTLLGGAVGATVAQVAPTTYTATASLFLEPLSGNPFSPTTATSRNEQIAALQTEVALLSTTDVAQRARAAVPDLPPGAGGDVSATVPSNSQVIDVAYSAPTAELAQTGAEAFAAAFLDYRLERAGRVDDEQAAALQQQLDDTSELLTAASQDLSRATEGTAEQVRLEQQVQLYAGQVSDLQVQVLALAASADNPGEVISPAQLPVQADGFAPVLVTTAGLLLGALLGVVIGAYREHSDPRMHTLDEVAQLGTGPALAVLGARDRDHVGGTSAGHRTLMASVLASLPPGGGVVALVGADDRTSSMDAAAGLSRALVRSGRACTVVLTEPVTGFADVGATLSELVTEDTDGGQELTATALGRDVETGLRVVAVAPATPFTSGYDAMDDLLQHESTQLLLAQIAASGRVVVVAAPPLPRGSALSLARHADQAVLLVRLGTTSFDTARTGIERLRRSGAHTLGTAVQVGGHRRTQDAPLLPRLDGGTTAPVTAGPRPSTGGGGARQQLGSRRAGDTGRARGSSRPSIP